MPVDPRLYRPQTNRAERFTNRDAIIFLAILVVVVGVFGVGVPIWLSW